MATGDYICVYDADAIPEKNAFISLSKKVLKDPERHVASFSLNKTRNANQNFLTRCINQEIVSLPNGFIVMGMWHLFKVGRIPETTSLFQTEFVKEYWRMEKRCLTDTDISFKDYAKWEVDCSSL